MRDRMAANWLPFCDARDLVANEPYIDVAFGDDRKHRVHVQDEKDAYLLSAFVVRQSVVASHTDLPVQTWLRNRAVALVGFRIDRRGRLVGEAWVPKVELTPEEFQLYVRAVAVECDRFEYLLTGRDSE